ncbi:MAG: hypothetical protein H6662_11790 [Ardenticatenaceae bacterium]|nr:hypothetical protein [Ardenticatenaceae bacterium]
MLPKTSGQLPRPFGQLPQVSGKLPQPSGQFPQAFGQMPKPFGSNASHMIAILTYSANNDHTQSLRLVAGYWLLVAGGWFPPTDH